MTAHTDPRQLALDPPAAGPTTSEGVASSPCVAPSDSMSGGAISPDATLPGRGLSITVHGTPAPQGSKRHVGRGIMVESSKAVKPWRQAVKYAALEVLDGSYPFGDGPVLVDVTFRFARPRSHYRTGRNAHLLRDGAQVYPQGKPDIDKLLRSTLDALGEALVWHDDSRVVAVTARKVYGEPGARVHVSAVLA